MLRAMVPVVKTRRAPALWMGAALSFGLVLVATGIATRMAVREASTLLVRGQADLLHDELRAAVARGTGTAADMEALLATFADEGLSYLAVLDEQGAVLRETGTSAFADKPTSDPPRGSGVSVDRRGDHVRVSYRRARRPRLAQRLGWSQTTRLVFEFTPHEAIELERRAAWGLLLAALAGAFGIGLAIAYRAQQRAAEAAQVAQAQSRHLASLGQMSAVLAHELRNPLASLKGHAQLLERALPESDKLRGKAELVVREAVRLERLSEDLLSFVRTGTLHRAPTDVAELVRSVCAGHPRVDLDTPAALLATVDGERLRQVLANLVDNALAAGDGGVRVTLAASDRQVVMAVRDHGPGIAAADLPRLFEPFFTTKTHGTGLGLAVALHIVQLHGGTLGAENADGGGARFTVRLPAGS